MSFGKTTVFPEVIDKLRPTKFSSWSTPDTVNGVQVVPFQARTCPEVAPC